MTTAHSLFLRKCKEAYDLVQRFLNDELSYSHLEGLLPRYEVCPQRGHIVKQKVRKSLQVLSESLEGHRYVYFERYSSISYYMFGTNT